MILVKAIFTFYKKKLLQYSFRFVSFRKIEQAQENLQSC